MASMGLFSFFNGYQSIANGCPGSQGLLNPPAVLTAPRVQPAAAAAPPPADQDMAAPYPPLAMAAAAGEPAAIDTSADGSADAEAFQLLPHPMDAAVGMHERPLEPLELQLDIHASLQLRELKQAAPPGPETFEHFARAREACINEMAGLTAAYKLDSAVFFTALAYFDNLFERAIHEHRELPLLALACFTVAAKMEEQERCIPLSSTLIKHAGVYGLSFKLPRDVMDEEIYVLNSRNWNMCVATPKHFVDVHARCSVTEDDRLPNRPEAGPREVIKRVGRLAEAYLCHAASAPNFSAYLPSMLSAAAVACARYELAMEPVWPDALAYLTSYTEEILTDAFHFLYSLNSAARYKRLAAAGAPVRRIPKPAAAVAPPPKAEPQVPSPTTATDLDSFVLNYKMPPGAATSASPAFAATMVPPPPLKPLQWSNQAHYFV